MEKPYLFHLHYRKGVILFAMTFLLPLYASAYDVEMFQKLDSVINQRPVFTEKKEKFLSEMKKQANNAKQDFTILRLYKQIVDEYYVYQYDSAKVYVKKGLELARKNGNQQYIAINTITNAELLTFAGLYHEASNELDSVANMQLSPELQQKLNTACFTLYNNWADYCSDNTYSPIYKEKSKHYLTEILKAMNGTEDNYDYLQGEYQTYVANQPKIALKYYLNAFAKSKEGTRDHARAAFAIANNYSANGQTDKYIEYLIYSAISDMAGTIKENLSLQYLASYLYGEGQHEKAETYIQASFEDAAFYNNRLRMIEVSRLMPYINKAYQNTIKTQNKRLKLSTIGIMLLCLGLFVLAWLTYKRNKQLHRQREEISNNNKHLQEMTQQLESVNARLSEANEGLADTNHKREVLARIFINLCAKYIDRMKKYQTLVKRKIKANQANELLNTISSTKVSEEDAAIFLQNFDKAFLNLYPNFVREFNALLQPEAGIQPPKDGTLTPELRIYALVRLGVKESSEIADLLFYSPQTIYNYRSGIKNRALVKETLDADVQKLCTTISG